MNKNANLKTKTIERSKADRPNFNAVVVYDHRNAADRALDLLNRLVHILGGNCEFRRGLWRFDVLALPLVREEAILASAKADLIIVSAGCSGDFPLQVYDWLNCSLAGKTPGSSALVGLLESHHGSSEVQASRGLFLQSAADRALMNFFLHEVDLPRTSLRMTHESLLARTHTVTSILQGILDRSESVPLQSFDSFARRSRVLPLNTQK